MDSIWPTTVKCKMTDSPALIATDNRFLKKRINNEYDLTEFKTKSPAYRDVVFFVDLLCEKIKGTNNKVLNKRYIISDFLLNKCKLFLNDLMDLCEQTDLSMSRGSAPLRFGHVAFRDWYDAMKIRCKKFICETLLANVEQNEQLSEELLCYLSESFGNRMRIDYGTGHELNFIIFLMGISTLCSTTDSESGDTMLRPDIKVAPKKVTQPRLKTFVDGHGWDLLAVFAHHYLRLCRSLQKKFRLEPAGSRGVYNMDDFQYLPFLFGAAQLCGHRHISTKDFYSHDRVEMFGDDFIFLGAVKFILDNKRGPFEEHSYTLWCFTGLGSWDNIYRRIHVKFTDDVLSPFPIVQHLLFGSYILRWNEEE